MARWIFLKNAEAEKKSIGRIKKITIHWCINEEHSYQFSSILDNYYSSYRL